MKRQSAFTLIELMIVVTIIAILGAIGFPVYNKQVQKGRRSDAQQLMMDTASKEEQYILAARAYSNSFSDLGISKDGWSSCSGTTCSNNFYDATITIDNSATPPTYTITATPKGTQADDGNLTLDSTGARTHAGSTGW